MNMMFTHALTNYQALAPGLSWTPWNRSFVKSQDLQQGEVWTQKNIFGKLHSFACAQQVSQIACCSTVDATVLFEKRADKPTSGSQKPQCRSRPKDWEKKKWKSWSNCQKIKKTQKKTSMAGEREVRDLSFDEPLGGFWAFDFLASMDSTPGFPGLSRSMTLSKLGQAFQNATSLGTCSNALKHYSAHGSIFDVVIAFFHHFLHIFW